MATITRQDIERALNTRGYVVATIPVAPAKPAIEYPWEEAAPPPPPIAKPPILPPEDLAPRVVEFPEFLKVPAREPMIFPGPPEEAVYEEPPAIAPPAEAVYEEPPAIAPPAEAAAIAFTKPMQVGLLIAAAIVFLLIAQRGASPEGGKS